MRLRWFAMMTVVAVGCMVRVAASADETKGPTVTKTLFGRMPDGRQVDRYTLANDNGLEVEVMTLGATLLTVVAPDRDGVRAPITLHKESLDGYLAGHPLFGSVVGRFANRIAEAQFEIDGTTYQLPANAGPHHIHGGGRDGFAWQLWEAEPARSDGWAGVRLRLVSPDQEAGYPGTLTTTVLYKLTDDNRLVMDYRAETDEPTVVNLTNHAYWNLGGADSGTILDHVVTIEADAYLATDEKLIPTGELLSVDKTPLDFRTPHTVGSRVDQLDPSRYDHCFVVREGGQGELVPCASVCDPSSGRRMEVLTTQPGVQFYTGNPHGLCLETQHYPNAPNIDAFPSTVLRPGQTLHEVTVHVFSTDGDDAPN